MPNGIAVTDAKIEEIKQACAKYCGCNQCIILAHKEHKEASDTYDMASLHHANFHRHERDGGYALRKHTGCAEYPYECTNKAESCCLLMTHWRPPTTSDLHVYRGLRYDQLITSAIKDVPPFYTFKDGTRARLYYVEIHLLQCGIDQKVLFERNRDKTTWHMSSQQIGDEKSFCSSLHKYTVDEIIREVMSTKTTGWEISSIYYKHHLFESSHAIEAGILADYKWKGVYEEPITTPHLVINEKPEPGNKTIITFKEGKPITSPVVVF